MHDLAFIFAGFFVGIVVGLTGVGDGSLMTLTSAGAGAIGITVLLILYPLLPLQRIVDTDIAYAGLS